MENKNPATPPSGATPGSEAKVITPPSATTPVPEGKVTISTDEFAKLTRDAARGRSAQRRNDLASKGNRVSEIEGASDDVNKAIREANKKVEDAEKRTLQLEVTNKVRDLLAKPEYAKIPQSTRDLILKNPAVISQAESLDEALLDVEDYLIDTVGKIDLGMGGTAVKKDGDPTPNGVVTPPASPGGPTKTDPITLEDTSKMKGPARSTATIRNLIKKAGGVQ